MSTEARHAARIATATGRLLVELRLRAAAQDWEAATLRRLGDQRAHELILDELTAAFPDDAVLSEEGKDDARRLDVERVWIVDPLDGTREFAEAGRTDWAVHVAFWAAGELRAGAVALPALRVTLSTDDPPRLQTACSRPRLVVSRTRPPEITEAVRRAVAGELVPMGSAGAKAMAVALGWAEVYAHAGGQYEWDSAAPVAVAAAAGLHVSRLDGSALRYNAADPYLPDVLVCRQELAERVIEAARQAARGPA